jgi:hypothetical protein
MFFFRECAIMFWSINGVLLGFARHAGAAAPASAVRDPAVAEGVR